MEDLRPDQLKYLEDIGLSTYDPSISPKINPEIIRERCGAPFDVDGKVSLSRFGWKSENRECDHVHEVGRGLITKNSIAGKEDPGCNPPE